jgi:hypothetical protein
MSRFTKSGHETVFSQCLNVVHKCESSILRRLEHISEQVNADLCPPAVAPSRRSFFDVLSGLFWSPQRILFLWNWKSAWLSILLRGPIFLAVTIRHGFAATISAVLTECLFCALSAGFYGALVQNLRDAEPEWLTVFFLAVVVPAVFQVLECLLHWFRGTPHLRVAVIASLVVSGISSLFNWYAMRRGALLVGGEGGSFGSDLRRLPGLLVGFVVALPQRFLRRAKGVPE